MPWLCWSSWATTLGPVLRISWESQIRHDQLLSMKSSPSVLISQDIWLAISACILSPVSWDGIVGYVTPRSPVSHMSLLLLTYWTWNWWLSTGQCWGRPYNDSTSGGLNKMIYYLWITSAQHTHLSCQIRTWTSCAQRNVYIWCLCLWSQPFIWFPRFQKWHSFFSAFSGCPATHPKLCWAQCQGSPLKQLNHLQVGHSFKLDQHFPPLILLTSAAHSASYTCG